MRGSPIGQVNVVLNKIVAIGSSRHHAKVAARCAGAKSSHEIGTITGIFSHNTLRQYRKTSIELMRFVKDSCGEKDITRITENHVSQFLAYKVTSKIKYGSST